MGSAAAVSGLGADRDWRETKGRLGGSHARGSTSAVSGLAPDREWHETRGRTGGDRVRGVVTAISGIAPDREWHESRGRAAAEGAAYGDHGEVRVGNAVRHDDETWSRNLSSATKGAPGTVRADDSARASHRRVGPTDGRAGHLASSAMVGASPGTVRVGVGTRPSHAIRGAVTKTQVRADEGQASKQVQRFVNRDVRGHVGAAAEAGAERGHGMHGHRRTSPHDAKGAGPLGVTAGGARAAVSSVTVGSSDAADRMPQNVAAARGGQVHARGGGGVRTKSTRSSPHDARSGRAGGTVNTSAVQGKVTSAELRTQGKEYVQRAMHREARLSHGGGTGLTAHEDRTNWTNPGRRDRAEAAYAARRDATGTAVQRSSVRRPPERDVDRAEEGDMSYGNMIMHIKRHNPYHVPSTVDGESVGGWDPTMD
jgi:hypothetical protein